ncbi:PEP/pyruvate-binding domain-containing protein, partial [bacterium]|nr:PEP/pyruvate-binding domain-containing protein [bacterium]
MSEENRPIDKLLWSLQERAKELNCLYKIEELLTDTNAQLESVLGGVVQTIPPGWQYPDICEAKIIYDGTTYATSDFKETPWVLCADIAFSDEVVGKICVYYLKEMPQVDSGPFLKEEAKLINTIADRLEHYLQYQNLRKINQEWKSAKKDIERSQKGEWRVALELLHGTDQKLYRRIVRKMFIRLCASGILEAENLQERVETDESSPQDDNRPIRKMDVDISPKLTQEVFDIAATYFSDEEILSWIQKWIQEDRSSFLVTALEKFDTSLNEIADAVRRFHHLSTEGIKLSPTSEKEVRVSLIRRFLNDQLEYINVAKQYVDVDDFFDLLQHVIFPIGSHGKVGGKSSGLFLATRILQKMSGELEILRDLKIPKTWYVTSDAVLSFVTYNNLEELVEQKYKEIDEIRREYDQIVQVFKHSSFPPEIIQGLSMALDDFGDHPLIVRSSSLLEDRFGAAFSGKYKSLFLANQGSKSERLEALKDAIAEVYSSIFGPDPIEYREERGLLDFREEMGILIQEVVGNRVGKYFLPAYAGVAFSNNEFRWSPRIHRNDGLVRMVPGLGTRAVDRLSDDYPILIAPGQPGMRVNVTPDEIIRYSPNKIDVINLETNTFETADVFEFLREFSHELPWLKQVISTYQDHHIQIPAGLLPDLNRENFVVTFEGLISRTTFVKKLQTILNVLQEKLGTPVDIEFASDGRDFYLLQCRPQSYAEDSAPAPIPKDVPARDIIFSANRYVSNGKVPDITHIVYVDPQRYGEISELSALKEVGRVVSQLNKTLPKRQFILMGPGRWGSRGDIKLGVNVTYSDINNTAVLIEIARKTGNYVPDLSFGTHFFQDLVEASIRYLPLYPDDKDIRFNEHFLTTAHNILPDIIPDSAHLADYIRVIDVPKSAKGRVLRVLMNADLDEAVGILMQPTVATEPKGEWKPFAEEQPAEEHWRWRLQMAERIAEHLDPERFG